MTRARSIVPTMTLAMILTFAGCAGMGSLGATLGEATGTLNERQADAIRESSAAVEKSFEDITPEQEYYIGRAVAATVLGQYPPLDRTRANAYLNVLGQTLALYSERPATFGGYHFLLLDSDEINAFAAPSGFILVAPGLLRCAASEAEVAAILAHEIGHVTARHGLQAIKKSRVNAALTSVAIAGFQMATSDEAAKLVGTFGDSIGDITATLVNSGYSREFEREADRLAVAILKEAGYDPWALVRVLQVMAKRVEPGHGFGKTHPDPADRIALIQRELAGTQARTASPPAQERRFRESLAGVVDR